MEKWSIKFLLELIVNIIDVHVCFSIDNLISMDLNVHIHFISSIIITNVWYLMFVKFDTKNLKYFVYLRIEIEYDDFYY